MVPQPDRAQMHATTTSDIGTDEFHRQAPVHREEQRARKPEIRFMVRQPSTQDLNLAQVERGLLIQVKIAWEILSAT